MAKVTVEMVNETIRLSWKRLAEKIMNTYNSAANGQVTNAISSIPYNQYVYYQQPLFAQHTQQHPTFGVGQVQTINMQLQTSVSHERSILIIHYLDGTSETYNWVENDYCHIMSDSVIKITEGKENVQIRMSAVKKIERIPVDSDKVPYILPDSSAVKGEDKAND